MVYFFFLGWSANGVSVCCLGFFLCPLLFAEHFLTRSISVKIIIGFITFLSCHLLAGRNLITNIEPSFEIFLQLVNSCVLTIPWIAYVLVKRKLTPIFSILFLITAWLTSEQLSLVASIPNPWFVLGNGFCSHPELIQFYEYSGVAGGSLWILLSNSSFFIGMVIGSAQSYSILKFAGLFSFITVLNMVPLFLSIDSKVNFHGRTEEVLILNTYKSDRDVLGVSLYELVKETRDNISVNTKYIVWPENLFASVIRDDEIENSRLVGLIRKHLMMGEGPKVVCGAILSRNDEFYNCALMITSTCLSVYKKKKLVPFTETSPALFKPFNLFKLSNIEFTTGPKKVAASSISVNICYELLFGNLVSQNCYESGGQVLASISNEYWIEGASELLVGIGSIRAIENRKFLIRSINNGIATLINPNGEVLQHFRSKKAISSIKGHVIPNNYQTFYMRKIGRAHV